MSFKHFLLTHLTESEIKQNFKVINEGRWWGKFKEDATSILEYKDESGKNRKFKVCKMEEDGAGVGPAYVLEARAGIRYGLFRATEGNFHVIRMKSGKKHLIKPKGIFREVDGKLVFELFTLKPSAGSAAPQKVSGTPEVIKQAVNKRAKKFDPNQTIGPVAPRVRVGDNMPPKPVKDKPFDPNATIGPMEERRANVEPDKSFPNGEKTFDKNTDEWNKGVYTAAKS